MDHLIVSVNQIIQTLTEKQRNRETEKHSQWPGVAQTRSEQSYQDPWWQIELLAGAAVAIREGD